MLFVGTEHCFSRLKIVILSTVTLQHSWHPTTFLLFLYISLIQLRQKLCSLSHNPIIISSSDGNKHIEQPGSGNILTLMDGF